MYLTKKEAKRLSVVKWKFFSNYNYRGGHSHLYEDLLKAHPELDDLDAHCGFCAYKKQHFGSIDCRGGCPMGSCGPEYAEWAYQPSKKTARPMLRKVQKVKV